MDEEFNDIEEYSEDDDGLEFDDEFDDDNDMNILGEQKKSEILDHTELYHKYNVETKNTKPFITKFEKIKIISIRSQQLSNGATSTIVVPKSITNTTDIAELEFKHKKIPFFIRRFRPDNTYEDWRLTDFVNIY